MAVWIIYVYLQIIMLGIEVAYFLSEICCWNLSI